MATMFWVLFWVAVVGLLVFFVVRERRARRTPVADFDRLRHQATAEADLRSTVHGPNFHGPTF